MGPGSLRLLLHFPRSVSSGTVSEDSKRESKKTPRSGAVCITSEIMSEKRGRERKEVAEGDPAFVLSVQFAWSPETALIEYRRVFSEDKDVMFEGLLAGGVSTAGLIIELVICGGIVIYAGGRMAGMGDKLAAITGLGRTWVGAISFVAGIRARSGGSVTPVSGPRLTPGSVHAVGRGTSGGASGQSVALSRSRNTPTHSATSAAGGRRSQGVRFMKNAPRGAAPGPG